MFPSGSVTPASGEKYAEVVLSNTRVPGAEYAGRTGDVALPQALGAPDSLDRPGWSRNLNHPLSQLAVPNSDALKLGSAPPLLERLRKSRRGRF